MSYLEILSPMLTFISIMVADTSVYGAGIFTLIGQIILFIALLFLRSGLSATDTRPLYIQKNTKDFGAQRWKFRLGFLGK
jgi:hypothetical protein